MSEKIVGIHGQPVPEASAGEVIPDLVQMLEDLLVRAKSGDIHAVGLIALDNHQEVTTGVVMGPNTQMFTFLGGITYLKDRGVQAIYEAESQPLEQ